MALVELIPVGTSWRVAVDGVFKQFTTQVEAELEATALKAQGKTPVVSKYERTDPLPIIPGGKKNK